jgi:hypothetical protein
MNITEHLLTCLGEEGCEVAIDTSKSNRFGLDDRNVLNPTGPTNRERLIEELNDLQGIVMLMVEHKIIPRNWLDPRKVEAKAQKVLKFMQYAKEHGALEDKV